MMEKIGKKGGASTERGARITVKAETVAQAFLELLSLRGIDYFFANPGTDYASIVDAFAYRQEHDMPSPKPLGIPHEVVVVSMAHGYYLVTGRPQAAMVHVGVGTANGLGAIMTASRARVPVLFGAGRTPITEEGELGCRTGYIHWGQECFDQAGVLREFVKWDYELRTPSQLEVVVDRALSMAMTEPRGPVYLTLPREVLALPLEEVEFQAQSRFDLPTFHPDPTKVGQAADLLAEAEFPLIITSSVGRTSEGVRALVDLAEEGGIGVVSFNPDYMNFPTDHPCHQGFLPDRLLPRADVVLVIDCDVPWYPNHVKPQESAAVIQVGIDPLYSRYPIRGFRSDLTLQGEPAVVMTELARALACHPGRDEEGIRERKGQLRDMHDEMWRQWKESATKAAAECPLDFEWVSYQVNRILGEDTVLVNEYDMHLTQLESRRPGSYFGTPHAGYLGWGVGAALGVKLASPEKTVVVTVGDGSYMFSVPSACHFSSAAYQLPILVIVYNNQCWNAVKRAARTLHPKGWSARTNEYPLGELQTTAHFEKICEAFGGYGERVESPDQVGPALQRAFHVVKNEKRQALLNMICKHP